MLLFHCPRCSFSQLPGSILAACVLHNSVASKQRPMKSITFSDFYAGRTNDTATTATPPMNSSVTNRGGRHEHNTSGHYTEWVALNWNFNIGLIRVCVCAHGSLNDCLCRLCCAQSVRRMPLCAEGFIAVVHYLER